MLPMLPPALAAALILKAYSASTRRASTSDGSVPRAPQSVPAQPCLARMDALNGSRILQTTGESSCACL